MDTTPCSDAGGGRRTPVDEGEDDRHGTHAATPVAALLEEEGVSQGTEEEGVSQRVVCYSAACGNSEFSVPQEPNFLYCR